MSEPPTPAVGPDLKAFLVLYVDDERANRLVFEHSFKDVFRIACVPSGEEALKRMEAELPAVIITDQRMPGMRGLELLAQVKQYFPDVMRVVLTAHLDPEPMLEAINRSTADHYLVKPWDRRQLMTLIASAIEQFRLRRDVRRLEYQMYDLQQFSMV